MSRLGIPALGWLTAILLSLVTLFVFGTLRNYGPDSTVRKFHEAAIADDSQAAANLATPNFDSASTQELWSFLKGLMANGSTEYEIAQNQRQANKSAIVVRYRSPYGDQRSLIWVVIRQQGRWVIDTKETTLAARYLLRRRT